MIFVSFLTVAVFHFHDSNLFVTAPSKLMAKKKKIEKNNFVHHPLS